MRQCIKERGSLAAKRNKEPKETTIQQTHDAERQTIENGQSKSDACAVHNMRGTTNETLDVTGNKFRQCTNIQRD